MTSCSGGFTALLKEVQREAAHGGSSAEDGVIDDSIVEPRPGKWRGNGGARSRSKSLERNRHRANHLNHSTDASPHDDVRVQARMITAAR